MKYIKYFIFFFYISTYSQDNIQSTFIDKTEFKADSIVGIDNFKTIFYTQNNSLITTKAKTPLRYSNIQLGTISAVNTFNPLKINIFYKAFNTVIILDNRLAEIYRIDFNQIEPYKNVSHVSTGSDNTIWIFNQDLMLLELYDYKNNLVRAKTLPVTSDVLDITSNYNSCWLLTKNYIYHYNYFGSLVSKIKNTGFTAIKESDENLIIKKDNTLFFIPKKTEIIKPIYLKNLLIDQFLLTNEILYIYTNGLLHQYQLKIK